MTLAPLCKGSRTYSATRNPYERMAQKPAFHLQTLLAIREQKKENAERLFGAALEAHEHEVDKQRAMQEELARLIAKREQKKREYAEKAMRGELAAQKIASANTFIDRLREQQEAQKHAIEGQKTVVLEKREEM